MKFCKKIQQIFLEIYCKANIFFSKSNNLKIFKAKLLTILCNSLFIIEFHPVGVFDWLCVLQCVHRRLRHRWLQSWAVQQSVGNAVHLLPLDVVLEHLQNTKNEIRQQCLFTHKIGPKPGCLFILHRLYLRLFGFVHLLPQKGPR